MIIHDLIVHSRFEDVWPAFVKLFADEEILIEKRSESIYTNIFYELLNMKPKKDVEGVVWIAEVKSMDSTFVDIYALFPDDVGEKYAIDLTEWQEVISMTYALGCDLNGKAYTEHEFLAALLYEITFHGFDQGSIRQVLNEHKNEDREARSGLLM